MTTSTTEINPTWVTRLGWLALKVGKTLCDHGPDLLREAGRVLSWFERRVLVLTVILIVLLGFLAWPVDGIMIGEHIVTRYACWNGEEGAWVIVRGIGGLAPPAH